ncbi:hypothetical protein M408DRAFT_65735 [Serendipita vermifera MAFF 305830]|uniref:Prefoldin subunit 6 n=1 Tax=Serendipita vermifera MAFF 305830 TaxID=933852 RepID=A0A0C3BF75_SERVB|nr:hypothetical protein M408DRAFT_65735 [Serendipita vermifera MAFF 305830]
MATKQAPSSTSQLETATRKYQDLQDELSKAVDSREKLGAQQVETESVKKEFATLKSTNTVYKLIGPVLVPQDQGEAKSNVEKRLEFISSELKRVEALIKDLGEQSEKVKSEIVRLQTSKQTTKPQGPDAPATTVV